MDQSASDAQTDRDSIGLTEAAVIAILPHTCWFSIS